VPTTASVAEAAAAFAPALARRLGVTLAGDVPPLGAASGERAALQAFMEQLGAPAPSLAPAGAR
jgi:hypothetical protein